MFGINGAYGSGHTMYGYREDSLNRSRVVKPNSKLLMTNLDVLRKYYFAMTILGIQNI